jgi:hypothetical protein
LAIGYRLSFFYPTNQQSLVINESKLLAGLLKNLYFCFSYFDFFFLIKKMSSDLKTNLDKELKDDAEIHILWLESIHNRDQRQTFKKPMNFMILLSLELELQDVY